MSKQRRRGVKGRPWYRKHDRGWYFTLGGEQVKLTDKHGYHIKGEDREADALDAWHSRMALAKADIMGDDNEVKVILNLYLNYLKSDGKEKCFRECYKLFKSFTERWPGLLVRDLKPIHLTQWWKEHETWGDSYRNLIGTAVKAALNRAAGAEGGNLIPKNPLAGMKLPRARSRGAETLISQEDHLRLLAIVPEDLKQILVALRDTGTRPSNLWRATAANLDKQQKALVFGGWNTAPGSAVHKTYLKTGQPLVVPLTPAVYDLCCRLADEYPEGPLFRTKKGEAWNATKLASRLLWYKKKLNLEKVILYGYRHTVATDLLLRGESDAMVAAILGHKGTAMIHRHYAHVQSGIKQMSETLAKHRPPLTGRAS